MKYVFLIFLIFNINKVVFADLLNPSKFMQSMDSNKSVEFFCNVDKMSVKEARIFIEDVFAIIDYKYEVKNISTNYLKEFVLNCFKQKNLNEQVLDEVRNCLDILIDGLIKREQKNNFINISDFSRNEFYIIKCKSNKKRNEQEKEISGGIVIGCAETLCGVLLWLTPFRQAGTGLMIDGVRRMLNDTEEQAKKNEKHQYNNNKKFVE